MLWLNILSNEIFLMVAETLVIVIGSLLMGIWLGYLYWGGLRKKIAELQNDLEMEKKKNEDLSEEINQVNRTREQLHTEILDLKLKSDAQAKTIFDQQQYIYSREGEQINQKSTIDQLNATIDSYQHRLRVIEEELEQAKLPAAKPKKQNSVNAVRANYEHVSQLLGKQVTENDLTVIAGIGPKTAALLQTKGIQTWEDLGKATIENLQSILAEAGGIYKSQNPSQWPRQAIMAAQGEWRKLRILQETLRKSE